MPDQPSLAARCGDCGETAEDQIAALCRLKVGGKPFHGWSCDCDECKSYDERGEPRPGEVGV